MGQTMTEQLLARAAGLTQLRPHEVVLADVALVAMTDSDSFIDVLDKNELTIRNPDRVVFAFDHYFEPWMRNGYLRTHPRLRDYIARAGVPDGNVYDQERRGISHQVPVEEGWILPGTVSIGADTQAASMGVANAFVIPALSSGIISVLATGKLWAVVPEAIRLHLTGALPHGVLGKDLVYRLMRDLGPSVAGRVIEVSGPGVANLSIDTRMAIANGAVQIGALTIIFPHDRILRDYLAPRARGRYEPVEADHDAVYAARHDYDLASVEPLISGPHDIDLIRPLSEVCGLKIDAGYIGSCSSGRMEDFKLAAEVLKGRRVAEGVRLVVTPISGAVRDQAADAGLLAIFEQAGAVVTDPGCGACYYGNVSPLKLVDGERCMSSSVETVPGRMGSVNAEVYLGNAAVVAASAIEGRIADPSPYLTEKRQ